MLNGQKLLKVTKERYLWRAMSSQGKNLSHKRRRTQDTLGNSREIIKIFNKEISIFSKKFVFA